MEKEYPFGTGVVRWVSTQWLEEHLADEDLMIIDTQPNIHDYILEHIPGAVAFEEWGLREPLNGLPGRWVAPEVAQLDFRRVGIRAETPTVVYTGKGGFKGWGDGLEQTMLSFSFARYGHDNVYVLDGGLDKWKAENRPVTKQFPKIRESNFKTKLRRDYFVDYDEFKAIKDRPDVILLDARPPAFYEGQGPWIKPGHIPGAINLPWASLMDDKNKSLLKPDEEIQKILADHGVTPDKTIICSCGTGREATNEFLLFKFYLAYPKVKHHEGAFTEWTAYPENPTVTGKNPR